MPSVGPRHPARPRHPFGGQACRREVDGVLAAWSLIVRLSQAVFVFHSTTPRSHSRSSRTLPPGQVRMTEMMMVCFPP